MLGSKTKNVCCTSLSLIRVLEIGVFLFDEAEELDSFYITFYITCISLSFPNPNVSYKTYMN